MSSLITITTNDSNKKELYYNADFSKYNKNDKIKVVSVIGKARGGKSTLLNLLLSKWNDSNQTIFKMSASGEHCTNGIDYYYCEDENIMLLDFQGIYLGDSSQDSKLLLIAYLLSDIIIFNENKMLSNNTLSQFEPMLSFIHYAKSEELKKFNPKLIFRISDMSLDIDSTTNMHQMLQPQNDQFQSIRDCINNLFDEPFAINTNTLDRSEIRFLRDENFIGILENEENNFDNAIIKITDYIDCCENTKTFEQFINNTKKIVNNINNETRIDFKKLDVVLNLANTEILKYILEIDNSIYNIIDVDGTQKLYEENLVKRINQRDEIIKDIYNKFKTIPKNIIDENLSKFTDKINPLIENSKKFNEIMAIDIVVQNIKKRLKDSLLCSTFIIGSDYNYEKWISEIESIFKLIEADSMDVFIDIYNTLKKNIKSIIGIINSGYKKEMRIYNEEYNRYKEKCDKFIEDIDKNIIQMINDEYEIETHTKLDIYYNGIIENKISELESIVISDSKSNKQIKFNYEIIIDKIFNIENNFDSIRITKLYIDNFSYDFIKLKDNYSQNIRDTIKNHEEKIYKTLSEYRENILTELKGNICNEKYYSYIIRNNPNISFVEFEFINNQYVMTQKYFESTLKKDFQLTIEICIKKGYRNDWIEFIKEITDIEIIQNTKHFKINFNECKTKFKDNCKKMVLFEFFEIEFKKCLLREDFLFFN